MRAFSLTIGWACRLQLLLTFASEVSLKSDSSGTPVHIARSQIRRSSNVEDQLWVFISLRNKVSQLHPQVLGSLSVFCYHSQGYCENMRTHQKSSQSQSCTMTDGRSDGLFWCQAPICWCAAPSLTRSRVCNFQSLLGIANDLSSGTRYISSARTKQIIPPPTCSLLMSKWAVS
jgi:hypothetical protein